VANTVARYSARADRAIVGNIVVEDVAIGGVAVKGQKYKGVPVVSWLRHLRQGAHVLLNHPSCPSLSAL
jgi:hypothetical protein